MPPSTRLLGLLALLVAPLARADEGPRKLTAASEKVATRAGPSLACLYVSRSKDYHEAPFWGSPPNASAPFQLGRFDAEAAAAKIPAKAPNRDRILRTIRQHDLSHKDAVPESFGGGIILSSSGLVLTPAHVVRNATRIYVRLPRGRGGWADIHAADPRSDLAVVRLLDKVPDLKPLPLGDSTTVKTGTLVVAAVNAYHPRLRDGQVHYSIGIVSDLRQRTPRPPNSEFDRTKHTLHQLGTLIQTDARVSAGCSGGALLDFAGNVLGMTTAFEGVRSNTHSGETAIPLDPAIRRIIDTLQRGEEVEYGFLGVELLERGRSVQVKNVSAHSPASRAGLRGGEYIVSINGNPVHSTNDVFLYIGITLAGRVARIEVASVPGGRGRTIEVTLAKYWVPGPVIASRRPPARGGLRVDYLSVLHQQSAFRFGPRLPGEGVMVREVVSGSQADKALLQPGKVITEVNGTAVNSPAEYYQAVAAAGARVELTVLSSDNRPRKVVLALE